MNQNIKGMFPTAFGIHAMELKLFSTHAMELKALPSISMVICLKCLAQLIDSQEKASPFMYIHTTYFAYGLRLCLM